MAPDMSYVEREELSPRVIQVGDTTMYLSERGKPLAFQGDVAPGKTVLTVELYLKWYELYAITRSTGGKTISITPISFEHVEHNDHVPYPASVAAYAEEMGWEMCAESMEMIIGRYMREVRNVEPSELELGVSLYIGEQPTPNI